MSGKRVKNLLGVVGLLGLLIFVKAGFAEEAMMNKDEAMGEAKGAMMDEAMMAKMKEYSTPNENHKNLDSLVGSWEYSMKWWMAPDATPEESTGTSETKWILGGRFIEDNTTGMAMGQPFEGFGITGFDNIKKEYTSIWLDNMGTGTMTANGTYDAATRTLTMQGTFSCPMTNGQRTARDVIKIVDENSHVYEMYMTDPATGKEFKSMEITYTRKK